jgi:DNA polymerase
MAALLADPRLREISSCRDGGFVPSSGPPRAPVMLVGEAPGEEEARQAKPFCGPSGAFLDEMLALAGIERRLCYAANVVPFRPPGNRTPFPSEIGACMPRLETEISFVSPVLIIALGATAWKALGGPRSVTAMHGQRTQYRQGAGANILVPVTRTAPAEFSCSLMCSYHPAAALRDRVRDREMREDFTELRNILERKK